MIYNIRQIRIYSEICSPTYLEMFQVVGCRHRRKANRSILDFKVIIFFLIPKHLRKYLLHNLDYRSKKVVNRRYSEFFVEDVLKDDLDLFKGHRSRILTMCDARVKSSIVSDEFIIGFKDKCKIELTKPIVEGLNVRKKEIGYKVVNLMNEGDLKKKEYNIIDVNRDLVNDKLNVLEGDKITIVGIQNLTTSSKNASEIVARGVLETYPVKKGIYIYNSDIILFYLQTNEQFRVFMWYLMLNYELDKLNQNYARIGGDRFHEVAERNMKKWLEVEGIEDMRFKRFKNSIEYNSDKETMFGSLIEEIKESKKW